MDYKSVKDSQVLITELMLPSHSNFGGKIHGGYVLNLMDQIAFACGSKHSSNYCVTASVQRVDFLNPVEIGELLTLKASVNYVGNTSMIIGIRVDSENIKTGAIKHCNSSYFIMVSKDSNGKSIKVPGLIIETKEELRRFINGSKQMDSRSELNSSKVMEDFNLDEYLHFENDFNIKINL
jgi:uncharacterized protein (TIGR00369 family)